MAGISRIEVRGVSRLYGSTAALRGVSVVFEPGPVTFIEGPNGAGKSTLLGVIGTLIRPTSGTVVYSPLGQERLVIRRQIGWVAHEARCYRELTARQNVELTARLYGVPVGEAWARVSARVGAENLGDRPVGTLSRGQRQRIALARALVHQPSVLLLDEPLSGLDAGAVRSTEQIVLEEARRGTIVIVVSHDAGITERLNGRKLVLVGGRIESDGTFTETV